MNKYVIVLCWSDEDRAVIAGVPELPGCMAHGDSQEDALKNVNMAIRPWIEGAQEWGRPVPQPKGGHWMLG